MRRNPFIALLLSLLLSAPCFAHVGSPDVYFTGEAGPYHLTITIRTPQMIPGVAEIEIRSDTPGVRQIKFVPLYITGSGSKYPPPPDTLLPSKGDPQFFSGKLWLMASGSWQVRIDADGDLGAGALAVPVPAFARATLPMQKSLGAFLVALMLLLVLAIVSIIGAARREGHLAVGEVSNSSNKRSSRFAMAIALVVVMGLIFAGSKWWKSAAADLVDRMIYTRPQLFVSLIPDDKMLLRISDSPWQTRRPETVATKLILDHGHLMHLFLIRVPNMDRFYHLHPTEDSGGVFVDDLPAISAGHYQIFADIVRESGFPDTLIGEMDIPETGGTALTGDDSAAIAPPLALDSPGNLISPLDDGGRMIWERSAGSLASNRLLWFKFRVEDDSGKPAELEPYMGMAGHAEFVFSDLSVFAHIHPDGSVAMAAVALADATLPAPAVQSPRDIGAIDGGRPNGGVEPQMEMARHNASPSEVSFPYGFPKPGLYRIFVQVKHAGQIETGVFDARVN